MGEFKPWKSVEGLDKIYESILNEPWVGSLSKNNLYPRLHKYDFDNIQVRPISGSLDVDEEFLSFLQDSISINFEIFSNENLTGAIEVRAPFFMENTTIEQINQQ